jgi:hypothetical protein
MHGSWTQKDQSFELLDILEENAKARLGNGNFNSDKDNDSTRYRIIWASEEIYAYANFSSIALTKITRNNRYRAI